jgi:hypothetical protein
VDNRIQVRVEEDRRVVSIDPGKALDRENTAQQERYRIAKLSHVADWVKCSGPFGDGYPNP